MKISGIYKIQSQSEPDRIYIGSAINISQRWQTHLHILRKNKHHSIKLQRHYNKYKEFDLVFIIIEPCLPDFLFIREQYYIDQLNPYFNICKKAGSQLGMKRNEETRKKMRNCRGGEKHYLYKKHLSEETKSKISEAHKGMKPSKETRLKMRLAKMGNIPGNKGKQMSDETKRKMSLSKIGIHKSEEVKQKISKSKKGTKYKLRIA